MINKIDRIKYSVQEVCEAVSAILSVDVTVVNTNLERIAATGKYRSEIGARLPDGCYYSMILENGKLNNLDNLVEKEKCKNCKSVNECEELATVGYPIIS
ncbi:MAG: AAA family ATPase, partial [Tissierellia bacterium]|nr:AAA family ATPase [Tissierellia bacterium]